MNAVTTKWIISKREDLLWFIFSSAACFIVIITYYLLTECFALDKNLCIIAIYFVWAIFFDGTHAFATYTRTFLDKEYYQENKYLLLQSLVVFLVGPLFLLSIYFINNNLNEVSVAFIIFNRFGLCFAYYHLIRQHWGFVVLYRNKNDEIDDITRKLDGLLLTFGSIYPFVHGQHHRIEPMHISETLTIPMEAWINVSAYIVVLALVLFLFSFSDKLQSVRSNIRAIAYIALTASMVIKLVQYFTLSQLLQFVSIICLIGLIITIITYAIFLFKKREIIYQIANNYPKWLLLFTVIFSYNLILHLPLSLYIIIASLTIFHNIQYHKIINYYNGNKYKSGEKERFGFAVTLAQKMTIFITMALAFNLISYVPRFASNFLITNEFINYILSSFFWGIAFHHYYLDSIIWKVKNNVQLSSVLKI